MRFFFKNIISCFIDSNVFWLASYHDLIHNSLHELIYTLMFFTCFSKRFLWFIMFRRSDKKKTFIYIYTHKPKKSLYIYIRSTIWSWPALNMAPDPVLTSWLLLLFTAYLEREWLETSWKPNPDNSCWYLMAGPPATP